MMILSLGFYDLSRHILSNSGWIYGIKWTKYVFILLYFMLKKIKKAKISVISANYFLVSEENIRIFVVIKKKEQHFLYFLLLYFLSLL